MVIWIQIQQRDMGGNYHVIHAKWIKVATELEAVNYCEKYDAQYDGTIGGCCRARYIA